MNIFAHWLLLSGAVFVVPYAVSGITLASPVTALIVGACLTVINLVVKPIINILTLPLNLLTLGLFSLVVNGLLFWFIGTFVQGFTVADYKAAFFGALIVAIINWIGIKVFRIE